MEKKCKKVAWRTSLRTVAAFAVLWGAPVAIASSEKTIPMPSATAFTPVGNAQRAQSVTGTPVMSGDVIRCLNKELSFDVNSGTFQISADGVTILQGGMPQRGHEYGHEDLIWMSPGGRGGKQRWKTDEKRTQNRIDCTYTLTFDDMTYVQSKVSLELLPDGLIRLTKEGFPSPKPETLSLACDCYLVFCKDAWPGTHYAVRDNPALVPAEAFDAKNTNVSIDRGDDYGFTYCPNDPARCVAVSIEKPVQKVSCCLNYYGKGNELRAAYYEGTRAVFLFDIRTGVKKEASPDERAGVDFRRLEDLEMPDDTHRNLMPNGSFESGFRNWGVLYNYAGENIYLAEKWTRDVFRIEEKGAAEGARLLSVHAQTNVVNGDVRQLGPYPSMVSTPLYLPKGAYTLSFSARGTRKGTGVGVFFPGFRYDTAYLPKDRKLGRDGKFCRWFDLTTEWKRYSLTIDLTADDVTWAQFAFKGREPDSRIELDAIQFERGAVGHDYEPPVAESLLLTSDPGNFCDARKPMAAKLAITSAKPNARGTVRIEARTFLDEAIFDRTFPFETDANRQGTLDLAHLDAELPPRGLFALKRTWTCDGDSTFEYDRLERVEFCDGTEKWKFLSSDYNSNGLRWDMRRIYDRYHKLGMNQAYHTSIEPREIREEYERNGISNDAATMIHCYYNEDVPDPDRPGKTIRRKLGWGVGHKDQNLDVHHMVTNHADRMKVYILNHKAHGLDEPDEAFLARFRDACAAKARDYPHIRFWEFANEFFANFDASWWNKECDKDKALRTYAKYLKAYYEGVKSVNPAIRLHADAPCNMDIKDGIAQLRVWAKILADEGIRMDGISFHTYRHSPEDPDLDGDLTEVFSILKENGYPETTQIYSGEGMHWGPYEIPAWGLISDSWGGVPRTWQGGFAFSYDIGQTERRAAAWRARSWLVDFKYAPRISQACAGNKNAFAMDIALTPFLNQMVANTLMRILGNADFVSDVRFAPYTRALVFRDAHDRPVVAVWNHKPDVDYGRLAPPVAAADFGHDLEGVYDLMYTPREVPVGSFEFPLLSAPLFFRGKPGTLEPVLAAIRKAHVVNGSFTDMYSVSANPASPTATRVSLRDNVTGSVSNYLVEIRTPLVPERPTHVRLRKEGVEYDGLVARTAPEGSTIGTLDWKRYPQVPLENVIGRPGAGYDARYRLAWNATGLFLEVAVKDTTFCHVLETNPLDRWANDSLQVYFDAYANARANTVKCYDTDDYEYSVLPEPDGSRCRVFRVRQCDWQLGLGTSAPPDRAFADDIPTSFERMSSGYRYRVFFPSKYLLPLKFEKGSVVGIGIAVNDANDPKASKRGRRVGLRCNSTAAGQDCYNKPYLYPAVLLWE